MLRGGGVPNFPFTKSIELFVKCFITNVDELAIGIEKKFEYIYQKVGGGGWNNISPFSLTYMYVLEKGGWDTIV